LILIDIMNCIMQVLKRVLEKGMQYTVDPGISNQKILVRQSLP
jgi:hypothetical protein